MSNSTIVLIGITFYIIGIFLITGALYFIRGKSKKRLKEELEELEKDKNKIISPEVLSELNRASSLINNEKLEEKYKHWQEKFKEIKEKDMPGLTDILINIENLLNFNDFKEAIKELSKAELEIYYVKSKSEYLLEEIKNITMSEERNRIAVTKLKVVYREIITKFNKSKLDYKEVIKPIELQFENIDKLFSAFEVVMERNEYDEVSKIVKALDDLINNMSLIIEEAPSIILLGKSVIPKKISDINAISKRMIKNGYNIEYLNLNYNIEETEKKLSDIFDRLNVLNLEDSMFELRTCVDYFDSIYTDFDKEKQSKKNYETEIEVLGTKLNRLTKIIKNIYAELGNLKISYDLTEEELKVIDNINEEIKEEKENYKGMSDRTKTKIIPYSKLSKDLELLSVRVTSTEDTLERTLRTLGSLKEDELRARSQLLEIKNILKDAKYKIKEYKLPIIPKNYFVELREANESIFEIVKELEKKPISIKVLNTRVDTARDLVLKLYNTSNELSKTAAMAEMAMVYGNRYRSEAKEIEASLLKAEKEFYKGEYKESLEIILNALNIVEPGIHKRLLSAYEN